MWDRFTKTALAAVDLSNKIAADSGEQYVSTEHLLLGLLGDEDNVACKILVAMGISPEHIRSKVKLSYSPEKKCQEFEIRHSPRAKSSIDLAYDDARQLNNPYIGTEHLLLGLIRERHGMAGMVLHELGVKHQDAYRRVEEVHRSASGAEL